MYLENRVSLFVKMCWYGLVAVVCWIAIAALPFLALAGFIWVGVTVARMMGVAI